MSGRRTFRTLAPVLSLLMCLLMTTIAPGPASSTAREISPAARTDERTGPTPGLPGTVVVDASDTPSLWFVEFATPPTADGGDLDEVRADRNRFRQAARREGLALEERYAFDTLWNGVSVRVEPRDLAVLSRMPEVTALYPVTTLDVDPTPESGVDLYNALAMTGADRAHDELGLDGAGVRVGILDTGIDYDHPDLGGCFGAGCRVASGWDFVGDDFAGGSDVPQPDPDPDDCYGHGTHVAGIVGADGVVTGVAPAVTLGAYRVFGCEGSTTGDVAVAAMERALADGMDVVNMSFGATRTWPQSPTAKAATRLVNSGVVVVASFGNAATQGLYAGGGTAMGDKVIAAASIDNTHLTLPSFEAAGRDVPYAVMTYAADPTVFTADPFVFVGRACYSDPLSESPFGRVALVERGGCTYREKVLRVVASGAKAVVIHNNRHGIVFGTVDEPALPWPVVGISQADGLYLRSLSSRWITWTDRLVSSPLERGGLASDFTSFGLSPDLQLKPDLSAPGGFVYSTIPLESGGYAVYSGTSMASPHIAGAAALLLQSRPNTPARTVRDILQNSADPIPNGEGFGLGLPELVHRQGAGLIDIPGAILATTKIEPGKLSLGESENGPAVRSLTVENNAASEVTYDLSHVPALGTSGVIDPTFRILEANVVFDPGTITIPAHGTASVTVTVAAPDGPQFSQYGGYVVFSPRDGSQVYRVPYAGFVGDYQAIRVLSDTPNGFPWLAKRFGNRYYNQPAGAIFSMQSNDIPFFLVHLDHHARRVRFEVFDLETGRSWHRLTDFEYYRRSPSHTARYVFGWDGYTVNGRHAVKVPSGRYRLRLSVQKALGNDEDPAHWEHWDSPPVIVAWPVNEITQSPEETERDSNEATWSLVGPVRSSPR